VSAQKHNLKISIVAELGTSVYSVQPIIDNITRQGGRVVLYTTSDNIEKSKIYLSSNNIDFIAINEQNSKWFGVFDYFLKKLLTKETFSSQYARIVPSDNKILNILYKIAKWLPKPSQKKINSIYSKFWSRVNSKPYFPTKNVLVVSRCNNTIKLNNKHHNFFTIVESWDHPVKSPFYYKSKITYSWNKELSTDMEKFQNNSKKYTEIFPLKFRYLDQVDSLSPQASNKLKCEIDFIANNSYVLYICSTSGYSKGGLFDFELKLIQKVLKACKKEGKLLYIKPHPHYNESDFANLENSKLIRVGIGATNNGNNYIFTDDDQFYKIQLLKNAERIINAATTLVLEASILNENIYQLKINSDNFGSFAKGCENYHIKNYLNSYSDIIDLTSGDIQEKLNKIIQEPQKTNLYSKNLKEWLSQKALNDSISEIINDISNENVSY
jgi:hypothetical protein